MNNNSNNRINKHSAEFLVKLHNMRNVVGDDLPTRTLEQFLLSTNGDVEAAVGIFLFNKSLLK